MNDAPFAALDLNLKSERRTHFEYVLHNRVVGQDNAIDKVSQAYEIITARLNDQRRPFSNTLLLGPTGVGKTLLVESIAEAIHGCPDFMLKIHCAEYSEDHQIARLIGSPPGYVGHDTTEPIITAKSLQKGWTKDGPKISIVLFDEIEKASPHLWQLLLGIMDKAELFDGKNNRIDMSRCWIFMTSNIGSRAINQDHIGIYYNETTNSITNEAESAAKKRFDPEFMGRLDQVITFNKLSRDHYDKVLTFELTIIWRRVLTTVAPEFTGRPPNLFTMQLTDELNDWLIEKGTSDKHGARSLRRLVEAKILSPLATIIATHQITKPGVVRFELQQPGDVITAKYQPHPEDKMIVLTDIVDETTTRHPETKEPTPTTHIYNTPGKYYRDDLLYPSSMHPDSMYPDSMGELDDNQ